MESDIVSNDGGKYKQSCSRLDCQNEAEITLEVAFLRKKGKFCRICAEEFRDEGLAYSIGQRRTN